MDDRSLIRCPACGSVLVEPYAGIQGMWQCRYHLCRAVFPPGAGNRSLEEDSWAMAIAEPDQEYRSNLP